MRKSQKKNRRKSWGIPEIKSIGFSETELTGSLGASPNIKIYAGDKISLTEREEVPVAKLDLNRSVIADQTGTIIFFQNEINQLLNTVLPLLNI